MLRASQTTRSKQDVYNTRHDFLDPLGQVGRLFNQHLSLLCLK